MNQIIADKTLETTKKFIQDRIHSSYLTESVRNKFTSLYANLTVDNAKEVYSEVFRLNGQLIREQTRELHYSMLKVSGIFFVGSVILYASTYLLKYFNINPKHVHFIEIFSSFVFVVAFSILFAMVH